MRKKSGVWKIWRVVAGALAMGLVWAQVPHLERRGRATQLVVDGKPYLVLGGELTNSASSSEAYMAPYWGKLSAAHLNTILAAVSWELIEPEEGRFDFSTVDWLLKDARQHNLRLILLWFGSWKNTVSTYAPLWVKRDMRTYPLVVDENGDRLNILSAFTAANWKADARAYAALMRHLREVDGAAHTVVMMQVENEVGLRSAPRDRSADALKAYRGDVPEALMEYLKNHREGLVPELRRQWEDAGGRTAGTWAEVFGTGRRADGIFMAWYYASYMEKVAAAGKAEYPIPVFVNAALGDQVGQYSSGGPLWDVMDVWKAAAPHIDLLSPCTYWASFEQWCARYDRPGNALFIPETRADPGQAFYAIGQHGPIGYSPFAIERTVSGDGPLAQAYDVLGQLAPLILEAQARGGIGAIGLEDGAGAGTVRVGDYVFEGTAARRAGAAAGAGAAETVAGIVGMVRAAPMPSYALVLATGPDEFLLAGAGIEIQFHAAGNGAQTVAIGTLEEGKFVDGRWVAGRRLNGDDTMLGYDLAAMAERKLSGQGIRLAAGAPAILRVRLYRY